MNLFRHLFGSNSKETANLLSAIELAVSKVEPLLKQTRKYPDAYRKPIQTALEYSRALAHSLPGPITINLDSYGNDAYIHAIFPSIAAIAEAFRSSRAMQDFLRENPASNNAYALMGMRRSEKTTMGMELSGDVIQRDVPQRVVYFSDHTIADPALTEANARERVALSFFNNLVNKIAIRVSLRKQEMQSQLQKMDMLRARLRAASSEALPALQNELSSMLGNLQSTSIKLDLDNYLDDFKSVLLKPEQYLHLNQTTHILDSMGVRRESTEFSQGEQIIFTDLIGLDRRNWTVTMVHCQNLQRETFAERLETAYRSLTI
jgi:hypothetical protein